MSYVVRYIMLFFLLWHLETVLSLIVRRWFYVHGFVRDPDPYTGEPESAYSVHCLIDSFLAIWWFICYLFGMFCLLSCWKSLGKSCHVSGMSKIKDQD